MAKGKSNANAWLARDKAGVDGSNYHVSTSRLHKHVSTAWPGESWFESVRDEFEFEPRQFHKAFPRLRLKPGEGPIPVRISIERAE